MYLNEKFILYHQEFTLSLKDDDDLPVMFETIQLPVLNPGMNKDICIRKSQISNEWLVLKFI